MKETNMTYAIRFTLNGRAVDLKVDDPGILIDLDTPEDYERTLGERDPLPRAGRSSTGR